MAQKLSKSALLAKQKALTKGAWKKSRKAEAKVKGQQLPGGLVKAVAKVIDGGLAATKEKGIPYYFIKGQVIEPGELSGTKFTKFYFLKATQNKSIEQKMEEIASDLQLLGQDVSEVEENDLPALFEGLKDEDIYFEFNTWTPPADKRNPNPQTIVFVQGVADAPEDDDAESEEETEEESTDEDEGNDEGEEEAPRSKKPKAGKSGNKKPAPSEEEESEEDPEEESEDETPEDESEDDGEEEGDEDGEESEDEWEPAVKEVYYYKPGPKAKKVEVAVTAVDKKKQTVKIKRLDTDKVISNVPWSSLEGEE